MHAEYVPVTAKRGFSRERKIAFAVLAELAALFQRHAHHRNGADKIVDLAGVDGGQGAAAALYIIIEGFIQDGDALCTRLAVAMSSNAMLGNWML